MRIAVANDHRGIEAKEQIKAIVTEMGNECIDFGTNAEGPVDYPDLAYAAATAVSSGPMRCSRSRCSRRSSSIERMISP